MANISAVIIAFNESAVIEKTVTALSFCSEIIVIDSGSTDNTVELCKNLGCKVFHHPFSNFGDQKQYGFSLAANNWILSVDADEVLSDKLRTEIAAVFSKDAIAFQAFRVRFNSVYE